MDDLARMRESHRVQHLQEQIDARRRVEPVRIAPRRERFALHVFHGDVRHARSIDPGIVEPGDARALQRCQDAAFACEALDHLGRHVAQPWNLQCHLPFECPVGAPRQPHLGHAAGTQGLQQFICAEPLACLACAGLVGRIQVADAWRTVQWAAAHCRRIIGQQCFAQGAYQRPVLVGQRFQPHAARHRLQRQRLVQQFAQSGHLLI